MLAQAGRQETPLGLWIGFAVTVLVLLALDLWSYRGEQPDDNHRKDFYWTLVWVAVSLAFGGIVWLVQGSHTALTYYAAYAMEKGLSLDNIFLFYVIFGALNIQRKHQHDVLFWGVVGAVIFRGLFIFLGVRAMERWEWVTYLFAAVLLYAAWKSFREDPNSGGESRLVGWLTDHFRVENAPQSGRFFVRKNGKLSATPLVLALIAIELTDVVFAVDSVPAALSITHDQFVVYSSNIFAVLGLRALYLYFAAKLEDLRYLHYGLAAVLAFAAFKILTQNVLPISPLMSMAVVIFCVGISIWASVRRG